MLQSLSIYFAVAFLFGIIAKIVRLPVLVGYLIAGVFIAFSGFETNIDIINNLGHIGVALLLFIIGLEIRIKELYLIGKSIVVIALSQIIFTFILAYLLCLLMGFATIPSILLAIGLSYSSTVIVVKLLSEKKDLSSLYGKLTVGILLIQDLSAIIIMVMFPILMESGGLLLNTILTISKLLILSGFVVLVNKYLIPNLFSKYISGSQELMFIFSIAWALGLAALASDFFGLSMEIGGFLAGITLASLPEQMQIISKIRPLRDFFLTLFFLYLGSRLLISDNLLIILPNALILSVFVIIVSPLIVIITMSVLGFRSRTTFNTAIAMAQISEFSLIVVSMGERVGKLSSDDVSLMVLVGIITFGLTSYTISKSDYIYHKVSGLLKTIERKKFIHEPAYNISKFTNHILLVGCDRAGNLLLKYFLKKRLNFLVVDFNPNVYKKLNNTDTPFIFGDISDDEVAQISGLVDAEILISTINNLEDNLLILEKIKNHRSNTFSIFTANEKYEALKLYKSGASYVVIPESVAGEYLRHLLVVFGKNSDRLISAGKLHQQRLIIETN